MGQVEISLAVVAVIGLLLIFQRSFWLWLFYAAGLAACFAMIASIIHLQILGAVGFFFLKSICWCIGSAISGV